MRKPNTRVTAERIRARWIEATGTGAAASIGLALLAGVCVFICVAAPRSTLQYRTRALQHDFAAMPASERSISVSVDFTDFTSGLGGVAAASDLQSAQTELANHLSRAGPRLDAGAEWSDLSTNFMPVNGAAPSAFAGPLGPQLEILYRDRLAGNSRLIAGRFPVGATAGSSAAVTFQVAVAQATAARFGLRVGSLISLRGLTLRVTGIFRPIAPGSAFWTTDPTAAQPLTIAVTREDGYWTGAVFVGSAELSGLESRIDTSPIQLNWGFPLRLSGVTADQAAALLRQMNAAATQAATLVSSTAGTPTEVSVSSGLPTDLASFVAADDAIGSMLSLMFVSLAVIGAVVVLLGARLLTEHRDGELALMRARGAALRQIGMLALRGGALAVLPAAMIAIAIAIVVTPGADDSLSRWLVLLTVLVAVAGPPAIALARHGRAGRPGGPGRRAASSRIATARRLVGEAALVCAAVGGLVVLRFQGASAPGETNLFTSAAPVLVAMPVAILVMRGYPVVLRWLLRLAGLRRGIVTFVGLARGTRSALTAILPAFALVLSLAVVAFGAMMRDAVLRGQVSQSWQITGADALVGTAGSGISIAPAAQHAIAAVPGVRRTATVLVTTGTTGSPGFGGPQFNVAVLDPAAFAAVLADTPGQRFPAAALAQPPGGVRAGPVPVLASPGSAFVAGDNGVVTVGLQTLHIRIAGTIASTPAMPEGGPFIVLPLWAAGLYQLPPDLMFLAGPKLDKAALAAVVHRAAPGDVISLHSDVLAALLKAPLPYAGYVALAEGAVAAGLFSVLIMLITLVLGARSRELTLARLATMGLSADQARRVVVVETVPSILAATIGGIACAWALVPIVGPVLDLSAFTGSGLSVPIRSNVTTLAITAAGLVILTLATLAGQIAVASRRGVGRALRVGE